jgi:hypothetical protein
VVLRDHAAAALHLLDNLDFFAVLVYHDVADIDPAINARVRNFAGLVGGSTSPAA